MKTPARQSRFSEAGGDYADLSKFRAAELCGEIPVSCFPASVRNGRLQALNCCSIPQSGIVIRCGLVSRRLPAEVNATSFVASEMVGTQAGFSTDGVERMPEEPIFPRPSETNAYKPSTVAQSQDCYNERGQYSSVSPTEGKNGIMFTRLPVVRS